MPRNLSPSEYLAFNDMISRIRALEHVAAECFMRGEMDRSEMATTLGQELNSIQIRIRTRSDGSLARCSFPYCSSGPGGVCEMCPALAARQQLAQAIEQSQSSIHPPRL